MDGVLLLHKPQGVTSFEALSPIKRLVCGAKVGHCGTLDRFASGLLIVLVGRMTRLNAVFTGLDKAYRATFHFGYQTDTLDPEGQIMQQSPCPKDIAALERESFLGPQSQKPPIYSAVHIKGQRCSDLARKGIKPDMTPRQICIHQLDVSGVLPDVQVDVTCSKGTYIRSLARDMGHRAQSCATVTALERYWIGSWQGERQGGFFLEQAHLTQDIDIQKHILTAYQALQALPHVSKTIVRAPYVDKIRQGQPFQDRWLDEAIEPHCAAVFGSDKQMLAFIQRNGEQWAYQFVVGTQN